MKGAVQSANPAAPSPEGAGDDQLADGGWPDTINVPNRFRLFGGADGNSAVMGMGEKTDLNIF